ncbi:MAG: M60 family metallopeptidase [Marinifilaceae bacterium]
MKNKYLLLLLCLIGSFGACTHDDDLKYDNYFEPITADTLWFGPQAATQTLALKALGAVEIIHQTEQDWCFSEISGTGTGQTVIVTCEEHIGVRPRVQNVRLRSGQLEQTLVVCQYGIEPVLRILNDKWTLGLDSVFVSVPIITTIDDYEVRTTAPWIHYHGVSSNGAVDTLKFGLSATDDAKRNGIVELFWNEVIGTISFTQVTTDTIYKPGNTDNLQSKVKIISGETSHPGKFGQFINTYDGYLNTFYDADIIPAGQNVAMSWNFKEATNLDYMEITPFEWRMSKLSIWVKKENEDSFVKYDDYDFKGSKQPATISFSQLYDKVKAVQVRINVSTEECWLSCREVEFFAKKQDLSHIFMDEICSTLVEGVAYADIMKIENDFYKNIAHCLYVGSYDKEFRVQEFPAYINANIQRSSHFTEYAWGFLDNATGIYAKQGETVVIMMEDNFGQEIKAAIVDWDDIANDHYGFTKVRPDMTSFTLRNGLNTFTANSDGLIYILYHVDNLNGKKPVKLHIASNDVNGYFDAAKHTNSIWNNLLSKISYDYIDVKGKSAHLLYAKSAFKQYCPDNILELTHTYDSIVNMEKRMSGLYKYRRDFPNRILFRVMYTPGHYMYAFNYQTAYLHSEGITPTLMSPELAEGQWGLAHEVGHIFQGRGITWTGMTEVSNNIFSLYVQNSFNKESRLIKEKRYEEAHTYIAVADVPFMYNDIVFSQVVPFWQLWLYFAKCANYTDIYPDIYEKLRTMSTQPISLQLNFAELCCELTKIDLSDFFEFYGFFKPIEKRADNSSYSIKDWQIEDAKNRIAAMNLNASCPAIQYITENNIDMFKNRKAVEVGTAVLLGNTLTMSNYRNVVAYEVYDSNKLIQIATSDKFDLVSIGESVVVKAVSADGVKVNVTF